MELEADAVLALNGPVEDKFIIHVDGDDNFPCFVNESIRVEVRFSESHFD
jgi:hypothetical protein